MRPVIVTTSWDDGHKLDIRLAELLKRYGIKATFYISPETREFPAAERLTAKDLRMLAKDFEIGAHTMTHPHLSELDTISARQEIMDSKETLERIIGKPVRSFCYPYGDYNEETKQLVAEAGFTSARSVQRFMTRSVDRFAIGTSVDTFDHRRDGMLSVLRLCGSRPWRILHLRHWDVLAKTMFAQARDRGEIFHLWGHSHEIEAHKDWERLEAFLAWLKEQPNVIFMHNADVPAPSPRVLITAPYFKPRSGGLEEYAYQIAKGLQDSEHWQVSIVTSGDKDETRLDNYEGLKVHYLPYRLKLSNTPFGFGWRRAIKRIIANEQPDIIVAHAPVVGMLDVTATIVKRIPLVVTYHFGSMVKGYGRSDVLIRWYEKLFLPRIFRKARGIICSSVFVQHSRGIRSFDSKTVVINPGVDTNRFKPLAKKKSGHCLMHVGGLKFGEEYKGLETSLRVMAELRQKYPDVQLVVVGNGERQPYYEKIAAQLGITAGVKFHGRLAGQALVKAYQAADVLLLPSHTESFGMASVEAMACGVPVVASRVGGIPEVVRVNETGFLVEKPDDISGFVKGVSTFFDDPALAKRFSQASRRVAVEAYQWMGEVAKTSSYLLEVAGLSPTHDMTEHTVNPRKWHKDVVTLEKAP